MKKVFVVGSGTYYATPFVNFELTKIMEDADMVLFTGGEDVNPRLYGDIVNPKSYYSDRDDYEVPMFEKAVALGKPILGICRGSQLLCALSGGKLVQHVENHGVFGGHSISTYDDKEFNMTSTHHQMMFPYEMNEEDYKLLAWSTVTRSRVHESVEWKDEYKEPEIVYFPKTKALGIQGHPEMLKKDADILPYLNDLVDKFLMSK